MQRFRPLVYVTALLFSANATAQLNDGRYEGVLDCPPSSVDSPSLQFTRSVTITVTGDTIIWTRETNDGREFARTRLDGAEFALDATGEYRSRSGAPVRWRTRGTVLFIEDRFNGDVEVQSLDGTRTYAECEVTARRTSRNRVDSVPPARQTSNIQPGQTARPPSAERSAPMQASALLQAPFGKKSDDMCLDGICLEDDAGRLADVSLAPRTEESRIKEAQFRALTNSRNSNTPLENAGMKFCADGNRSVWGKKVERLCEILILRVYRPIGRDDLIFLRENPLPVCVTVNGGGEITINTQLGLVTVELRFANDGRLRVDKITKEFAVDDASDKSELRRRLIQKHQPYFVGRDLDERASAPWGGSVKIGPSNPKDRVTLDMEAMSKRFGEKPIANECAPPRKQIDVR